MSDEKPEMDKAVLALRGVQHYWPLSDELGLRDVCGEADGVLHPNERTDR